MGNICGNQTIDSEEKSPRRRVLRPLWRDEDSDDECVPKCIYCARPRSTPAKEVLFTKTAGFGKETPSKELEVANSVHDTEATTTGTPHGAGLAIEIPQDDDANASFSGSSVDLSDEEGKGQSAAQEVMAKVRGALRLMRSSAKTFASGDAID